MFNIIVNIFAVIGAMALFGSVAVGIVAICKGDK